MMAKPIEKTEMDQFIRVWSTVDELGALSVRLQRAADAAAKFFAVEEEKQDDRRTDE